MRLVWISWISWKYLGNPRIPGPHFENHCAAQAGPQLLPDLICPTCLLVDSSSRLTSSLCLLVPQPGVLCLSQIVPQFTTSPPAGLCSNASSVEMSLTTHFEFYVLRKNAFLISLSCLTTPSGQEFCLAECSAPSAWNSVHQILGD